MREGIKTSLVSLVCAAAVSTGAFAAASVRSVGGAGTYTSAADAVAGNSAARAGSLRATGGFVRPTAAVSKAGANVSNAPAPAATAKVGTASATPNTTSVGRVASAPRLSVGKYIGAQKSVSNSGASSDLTQRLDKIESDVSKLESDKQDVLRDSTYVTISGDEINLELDKIRQDLEIQDGEDGREVEMGENETALLWRYAGETQWNELITWSDVAARLALNDLDSSVTTLQTQINALNNALADKLANKFDGSLSGQVLVVGSDGGVTTSDNYYDKTETANLLEAKLDANLGASKSGGALVVDENGNIVTTKEFATKSELSSYATKTDLSGKISFDEWASDPANVGKTLLIDENGRVTVGEIDMTDKISFDQWQDDTKNRGKALVIGSDGKVTVSDIDVDVSGKLDVYQETTNANKLMVVGTDGNITTTESTVGTLAFKNTITNDDVDDNTLDRAKMADTITETLNWIDEWRNSMPKDTGLRYVFAVDENGDAGWFQVISE